MMDSDDNLDGEPKTNDGEVQVITAGGAGSASKRKKKKKRNKKKGESSIATEEDGGGTANANDQKVIQDATNLSSPTDGSAATASVGLKSDRQHHHLAVLSSLELEQSESGEQDEMAFAKPPSPDSPSRILAAVPTVATADLAGANYLVDPTAQTVANTGEIKSYADNVNTDPPPILSEIDPEDDPTKSSKTNDVIWLLLCFLGIMASFVCYGLLLEYTTSGGRKLHELSFLFVTSGLYTLTAAAGRYVRAETPTTIPPARFAILGLTSMGSTFCSVRSLRYVTLEIVGLSNGIFSLF